MGWDIAIIDDAGNVMEAPTPHGIAGSTYCAGDTRLQYSLTYNYGKFLRDALGMPFGDLDERNVAETAPLLMEAILKLEDDNETDYWQPTSGNARRALLNMLCLSAFSGLKGKWSIT